MSEIVEPHTEVYSGDSEAIIRRADMLQNKAREVIETLRLEQQWNQVGRVAKVGSSQFGLMASPNLDFEIYVEKPEISVGFEVIQMIAHTPGVKQILYLTRIFITRNSVTFGARFRTDNV